MHPATLLWEINSEPSHLTSFPPHPQLIVHKNYANGNGKILTGTIYLMFANCIDPPSTHRTQLQRKIKSIFSRLSNLNLIEQLSLSYQQNWVRHRYTRFYCLYVLYIPIHHVNNPPTPPAKQQQTTQTPKCHHYWVTLTFYVYVQQHIKAAPFGSPSSHCCYCPLRCAAASPSPPGQNKIKENTQ